ncbi:MAG: DUF1538 domain-containing protein [Clostridia bacterium]|nr:DUF1538 domain-containing protein [Clostridia bacterium]
MEKSKNKFRQRKTLIKEESSVLRSKMQETLVSVLPVVIIVLILSLTIVPVSAGHLLGFFMGALLIIVGVSFFGMGVDIAMTPLGERLGASITRSRKIWLIIITGLVVGFMVTVSEPDLQVLASQVASVPNSVLVLSVSLGVGVCLMLALLRIVLHISLRKVLLVLYVIVFALAAVVAVRTPDFLAVAFDSGGVTTGPMTVPFIMALGLGVASIRSDSSASEDSFGLLAICSVGPIVSVFILGLIFNPGASDFSSAVITPVQDTVSLSKLFLEYFPDYFAEVAVALAPIFLFFIFFQIISMRLKRQAFLRMLFGFLYTYLGLCLFLTGANVGFSPAAQQMGNLLGKTSFRWLLLPIGMLMGYFLVKVEPAVHVLNKQVEEITAGAISQTAMYQTLSIGMAVAVGLAMVRVLTGISILWFLIPGYLLSLGLTFAVPRIFTAIAFDSGGVASGAMTATFLLPLAIGACEGLGGNVATDAFGVVAMVAMTPLIVVQLSGLRYQLKLKAQVFAEDVVSQGVDDEIVELYEDEDPAKSPVSVLMTFTQGGSDYE